MCADIFEVEEDGQESMIVEENEWTRLKLTRTVDGFREGIENGQNEHLQKGFDSGFSTAVAFSFQAAKLRGAISALLGYNVIQQGALLNNEITEELQSLLEKVIAAESSSQTITVQEEKGNRESEKCAKKAESDARVDTCCGNPGIEQCERDQECTSEGCVESNNSSSIYVKNVLSDENPKDFETEIWHLKRCYEELLDRSGIEI